MGASFSPLVTGHSRVFIVEGRARPDHKPSYQSSMKAGSPSQSFGDIEKIEVPSSNEFGKFDEIGQIRGAVERVTITLTGRYARDLKSELLRMARAECAVDVHINLGACTDPSDYNTFEKKVVLENAFLTSWEAEDLGALGSDEQAKVDESAEISARDIYELVAPSWASRGGDIITNEMVDVTLCDTPSCGDCDTESTGCKKFFAITTAAGGSPTTPPDVVYSLDGGATWLAHDIESIATADSPNEVDCLGAYLVVVSEDTGSLHYALLSEFDDQGTDPVWTEVLTGFVAGGDPRAISTDPGGKIAFIVGEDGYIYTTEDPTAGVTVRDAGVVYPLGTYNAVDALTEEFAVAVGSAGAIAVTQNASTWAASTSSPVGVGVDLNTVAVKNESVWLIGASDGNFYYTLDGGVTWTTGSFSGSGAGSIQHIEIANDTVVYMAHQTAGTLGRILRSTNGGYDWVIMPDGAGALPLNDRINAIAACAANPDIVVGVGLADDATDGFIVSGSD